MSSPHAEKPIKFQSWRIPEDQLCYQQKYDDIEQYFLYRKSLRSEFEKSYQELEGHLERHRRLKNEYDNLQDTLLSLKQEFSVAKAERDQAIGESFVVKQNGPNDSSFDELMQVNTSIEDTLVKVKIENAMLSQELDTVQSDLECYQKLAKEQDNEIFYLTKELERNISQREMLREKLNLGEGGNSLCAPSRGVTRVASNSQYNRNTLKFE